MENNKKDLIIKFGEIAFNDLLSGYKRLIKLMLEEKVGGCIVHAKRQT